MTVRVTPRQWVERAALAMCLLLALFYLVSSAQAIWQYGWTELFADQFRQYAQLLALPFPDNVLRPDNSHRLVTSNLVRLADLNWRGADQDIGVAVGLLLLLAMLAGVVAAIWRDATLTVQSKVGASLIACVCLMWLGSGRMQLHGNESVQVYLVMLCTLAVLHLVEKLRLQPHWLTVVLAWLAASVAFLSFGSGVAVFGLLLVMPYLRGVRPPLVLALIALALASVALSMFVLPGNESQRSVLSFEPIAIVRHAGTFLASFWATAWLSYADVGIGGVDAERMMQERLGTALVLSARAVFALTGQPSLLNLAFAIGLIGLLWLSALAWRAWRQPEKVTPVFALGLGLALFAAGVAVLVALARGTAFANQPGQVIADRYVPWSCVFWLGLALATLGRFATHRATGSVVVGAALVLALLFLPSQRIGRGWAAAAEREMENRAAQMQVGIMAEGVLLYADMPNTANLQQALDVLRSREVAMFRQPRNRLLGQALALPAAAAPAAEITLPQPVREEISASLPAWRATGALFDPTMRQVIQGVIVVDAAARVVGVGEFSHTNQSSGWRRLDDIAERFDLSFRATPPCADLRVFGVDDAAQRFVYLADLEACAEEN